MTALLYIETGSTSPSLNLAFEEYFLKEKDLGEDCFMLYCNLPAIVVGRFQNTFEEINPTFTNQQGINIMRRISGGGAVYHDLGNLCFSFIYTGTAAETIDKSKLARPVAEALSRLGIQVELSKRNDMFLAGKKFSGNAMALSRHKLLYHGTLLFDADLEILTQALIRPAGRIESKGIQSIRSEVTNLKPYFSPEIEIGQFKQALIRELLNNLSPRFYEPTRQDLSAITDLAQKKYLNWDWTIGSNPPSSLRRTCDLSAGILEIHLELETGRIMQCILGAQWLDPVFLHEVETRLTHVRYELDDVREALDSYPVSPHLKESLIHCLMGVQANGAN